ncbi:hypothetical protein DWY90_09900 [Coprococcus sp. AF27-8]|nr:hypothetical protein DWY90_09900 [Coprococcus sp. AF27-8]
MLKMVDGTGIIGVDMVCPLGGTVSPPQPPNFDKVEVEGGGSLMLPNSLKAPLERVELIGNSVQGENPAPDNPQEIKSAGRKSKNLFNIADLRVGQVQKDGTINEKSTYYRTAILDVPQDGKYRITFNSNDDYIMLYFTEAYANGAYSQPYLRVHAGNPNYYITLAKGKNILSFSTHTASEKIVFTTDHNIMIAAESETLGYEPYGYFFDLKITGKNLFDREKARDTANWIIRDGDGYAKFPIRVGKGNEATFSYTEKLTPGKGFYLGIAQSDTGSAVGWLYHSTEINLNNNKFTVVAKGDCLYLSCNKTSIQKFFDTIQTLQVEIGSEQTEYEPYTEQTVQIALDEPLRGIGEYKDVLTKDGVVRKIAPYEVNLNDLRDGGYSKTNTVMFSVKVQNKTVGYASSKPSILCNILPDCALQMSNIYNNDKECIAVGGGIVLFRVNKSRLKDISSFEATKQSFIELMADKKMIVEYALETPVTEPLPESVQAQLQALHSENGTTHVFVDSGEVPCGIKLTYRKEK